MTQTTKRYRLVKFAVMAAAMLAGFTCVTNQLLADEESERRPDRREEGRREGDEQRPRDGDRQADREGQPDRERRPEGDRPRRGAPHGRERDALRPPHGEGHAELIRRARHLHAAAENLEAAGLHEEARRLREGAEEMMRQARRHRDVSEHGPQSRDEYLHSIEIEALREEVGHLRREVRELHEIVRDLIETVEAHEGDEEEG